MRKSFLINVEMSKYFPIYEEAVSHIWLCNCSTLNFLIYEENLIFFFYQYSLPIILHIVHVLFLQVIQSTFPLSYMLLDILCLPGFQPTCPQVCDLHILHLERLTGKASAATVLGSIPASSEFEGRQMKQCWIKYQKRFLILHIPVLLLTFSLPYSICPRVYMLFTAYHPACHLFSWRHILHLHVLHMWFSKPSLPSFLYILVSTYPAPKCPPSYLSSVLHVLHQIYPPTSPFSSSPDTAENVFHSNLIHKNILAFQPPISTLLNLHFILCYLFQLVFYKKQPLKVFLFVEFLHWLII